jgi:type I restriction enzyme R subunit
MTTTVHPSSIFQQIPVSPRWVTVGALRGSSRSCSDTSTGIIQSAQDALEFLSEALRIAHAIVNAGQHPNEAVVVLNEDHVGVLSRIIHDHAPARLTVMERNLAEEIDQVVTRTLARSWDNADARNRGVRRATAAVFRRYMLKPVGEPYASTVAYIEARYLVD